ncbi:MAG: N-acetylmuramoyl-L-alanine amidase, partial [Geminicoccaceae bacterium]|nr:N-acetylmuramoyl-L-alanine amidase [Geminicoccaceae bacterium]
MFWRNCIAGRATGRDRHWSSTITTDCSTVSEFRPSPNFDERPPGVAVDAVILHYTGMRSADEALARLCDVRAKVSAHYFIGEDGWICQLVPEIGRAWHAGVSGWAGRRGLNDNTIGIEIVNPGHEWGYRPFPGVQMDALAGLLADILERHGISRTNVLAHSDVAPARKEDPGELFDWAMLARQGLAIEIGPAAPVEPDARRAQALLKSVGYDFDLPATGPPDIIRAFQ